MDIEKEQADKLYVALRKMVRLITDGSHYNTENPYIRPQVKEALKVLGEIRGIESYFDANEGEIEEVKTYNIVRYYKNSNRRKIIKRGVYLEEAQEHCKDATTESEFGFDGYEECK